MRNKNYDHTSHEPDLVTQPLFRGAPTLDWKYLDKSYVVSVIKRRINVLNYSAEAYEKLRQRPGVKHFFKRVHRWQLDVGIHEIVKRHPGYSKKFFNTILNKLSSSQETFMENVGKAKVNMAASFTLDVSVEEHRDAILFVHKSMYGGGFSSYRPTKDECWAQVKKPASAGSPDFNIKKGDQRELFEFCMDGLKDGWLDFNDLTKHLGEECLFTGAFQRTQINSGGLKNRLVFAVSSGQNFIEGYFNVMAVTLSKTVENISAMQGLTQVQIRDNVGKYRLWHSTCVDYKAFDHKVHPFIVASIAALDSQVLLLNKKERRQFWDTIAHFIRAPVFHPDLELNDKVRGLTSGSGYTSSYGTKCNMYITYTCVRRYCTKMGIPYIPNDWWFHISSDDTIIHCRTNKLNFKVYAQIVKDFSDMDIEFESYSCPSTDDVFFLGSRWVNGVPYRDLNRMLARICFGSGNSPMMTDLQRFQSRAFEILGNVGDAGKIYDGFNMPYPTRVFRFKELADHSQQLVIKDNMSGKEKRGFFMSLPTRLDTSSFSSEWMRR